MRKPNWFDGRSIPQQMKVVSARHHADPSHATRVHKRIDAILFLIIIAIVVFIARNSAHAATVSWNDGSANWSTNNWTGGVGSAPPTATDAAVIGNNGVVAYDASTGTRTVLSLQVGSNNAPKGNGTLNISGGSLTITNNVTLSDTGGNTAALSLTGGALTVGGIIADGGNGASVLTLNGGTLDLTNGSIAADTLNFQSGTLQNVTELRAGNNSTVVALTKTTAGTLTLTGTNAYTGATAITAGIVNIQSATALGGTTNGTSVSSGATLQVQGGISVGAEALTLNGTGAAGQNGALVNVSGTNNYGGLVTLGSASTISSDDGGTLNLTNTGTITGSGLALTLTGTGNGSVASIIGTGAGNLIKSGTGTWTLTGNNTYTGTTTISAGTLRAGAAGALGSGTTGTTQIDVNGTGTVLQLTGSSGVTDRIRDSANIRLNGGTFDSNGFTELAMGALTLQTTSILDMGTLQAGLINDILKFANSSSQTWSGTLNIYDWSGNFAIGGGTDQMFVGVDTSGLTASQLAEINFYSDAGATFLGHAGILANGEVVPIPEPSTWLAAALALGAIGFSQGKRLRAWASSAVERHS